MKLPLRTNADLNTQLDEVCELAALATTVLHASTSLLSVIGTLGEASSAMADGFRHKSSAALESIDIADPQVGPAALAKFLELVDLGRVVARSMSHSFTTLASLLGENGVWHLSNQGYYTNTFATLDTGFRNVFGRLSLLEANVDQKDFATIHEGITSLRDQHALNAGVARETVRGVEVMLGRTIRLLRLIESLVADAR